MEPRHSCRSRFTRRFFFGLMGGAAVAAKVLAASTARPELICGTPFLPKNPESVIAMTCWLRDAGLKVVTANGYIVSVEHERFEDSIYSGGWTVKIRLLFASTEKTSMSAVLAALDCN